MRHRRWAVGLLLPVVLLAVAGTLRFYRLGEPPRTYFDEVYYVPDARDVRDVGVETGFTVHPPVGKWLMAGSTAVFGDGPVGWRFPSAAAGTLTVLAVYLAGLRLFRRRGAAALAAFLLAVDGLALTASRIAMLDALLGLFVVAGFWLLLEDRERLAGRAEPGWPTGMRWLAGLAFGLAVATKWAGVLALAGGMLLALGLDLAAHRRAGVPRLARPPRLAAGLVAPLVLLPAVVYVASYAGWFASHQDTRRSGDLAADAPLTEVVGVWWDEQRQILRFHRDLEADHPYKSAAATWPLLSRPVAYFWEDCAPDADPAVCLVARGHVAEVLGKGNPAAWWLTLAALPLLAWFATRERDPTSWVILGFLAVQYVPWLLAARPLFLFYMVPVVPFMALALSHAAWRVSQPRPLHWLPVGVAAVAAAAFLYWYPLYAAVEIPRPAWEQRIWFDSWI